MSVVKKLSIVISIVVLIIYTESTALASSVVFDNFNDGNADGWWLGYSHANPSIYGNWRVENGELVQDTGYDGVMAQVENKQFSDQVIETRVKINGPSGGGGILFWYQSDSRLVWSYITGGSLYVYENVNGTWYHYLYTDSSIQYNQWYNLKVGADSVNGTLKVYLDGNYLFTYNVVTTYRNGKSGVFNGNAGGYFDDFKLTYPDQNLDEENSADNDMNTSFKRDMRCVWKKPAEIVWIKLEPVQKENIFGMEITWTQYDANEMSIDIDDGTGTFPFKIANTLNDGHEFLPNVYSYQKIMIKPINHCNEGDYSLPVSYSMYPNGWYNIK